MCRMFSRFVLEFGPLDGMRVVRFRNVHEYERRSCVHDVPQRNEKRTRRNVLHRVSCGYVLDLSERRHRMHVVSVGKIRVGESILRMYLVPRRSSQRVENREQCVRRVRIWHVLAIARSVRLSGVSARRVLGHSERHRV